MRMSIGLCVFDRHSPIRDSAKWDGLHFVSTCRHCGTAVRRKAHKVWLKDWLDEAGQPIDRPLLG